MTTEILIWTVVFFAVDLGVLAWLSTIAVTSDRDKVQED